MYRKFVVTAFVVLMGGPAFAAGGCSTAPAAKFQPKASLETKLKA